MAVKTPSYWKEEKYQPLIEVSTLYGNKVKVPERFLDTWEYLEKAKHRRKQMIEQLTADGFRQMPSSNKLKKDLQLVFYEIYEE